jgi:predicted alpha/beta superfamily hydrolase
MHWQNYPPDDRAHTVVGTIRCHPRLHSPQLDNERDILVYLPRTYGADPERRYPVLYMHDGQNLFDGTTSFGAPWDVDDTLESLGEEAGVEAIVVGIPNAGESRCDEYSPFVDARQGGGRGDDYIAFIADTVKPLIDASFRTISGRAGTGIAGSSMGGLISLYAFFARPDVFGFVGAMSPALWFADRALLDYVRGAPFAPGRIYMDAGTREGGTTLRNVAALRTILLDKGYRKRVDLICVTEPGGEHNEAAWSRRLRRKMHFLLDPVADARPQPPRTPRTAGA